MDGTKVQTGADTPLFQGGHEGVAVHTGPLRQQPHHEQVPGLLRHALRWRQEPNDQGDREYRDLQNNRSTCRAAANGHLVR